MKKVFFTGVFALVLVAIIGYGINKNQNVEQLSDLALQNVEALAQFELGTGGVAVGDTGPGEIIDCAGPLTGSRKECMSRNSHPCTPRSCM